MSIEFKREERYIVFKLSDLGNSLKGDEIRKLAKEYAEYRKQLGKKPLVCVVVESDWPEYEPTWSAIESRVTGAQPVLTTGLGGTFRAMGDNAYCAYIQQMRREVCLGWEHKVQAGKFGYDNLDGFMRAAEWLGRHKALVEAERMANDLQAKIDALMLEYCPDEMTEAQKERWAQHQQVVDVALRHVEPIVPDVEWLASAPKLEGE